MSTATDGYIESWAAIAMAFNTRGDLDPFYELLSDDCTMDMGADRAVDKADIKTRLDANQAAGWYAYHPMTMTAHGPFLVAVSRNLMRDGTAFLVAGAFRFDDAGKIVEIRQMNTVPA